MNQQNIVTKTQNTWCIGCGNFAILTAIKVVINELIPTLSLFQKNRKQPP